MKISEMTNDQTANALIRLAVPFSNICNDEEVMGLFDGMKDIGDAPIVQTAGKMLPQIISCTMKTHRNDLYEIIGALTEKSRNEVAKMNFLDTIKVVRESYDDVLKSFFTSSVEQTKGSAQK